MEKNYDEIARIVSEIQQGNDELFDCLYELTKRMVYFELKSAGVNEADTEDILQETYIKIYNKIHTIEDVQASYKWIKQLAYRTGINYVKSSIVSHEYLTPEGTDEMFESEDSLSNPLPMPEDIMQNAESQRLVREILQELPTLQYKMIVAYYYNESGVKEIAEVFDVPEGTVKTNLFRARAEIKSKVENLEKKQGIKLYSVALLPLFSFFIDMEVQAAELPAFMQQGEIWPKTIPVSSAQATGAAGVAVKNGGLSLGVKFVIGVASALLVVGGVVAVSDIIVNQPDKRNESVTEPAEADVEQEITEEEPTQAVEEEVVEVKEEVISESEAESEEDDTDVEDSQNDVPVGQAYIYEGEIRICANNFDGTYEAIYNVDAVIDAEVIANAKTGDIVTTQMGDQYVLIEREVLYQDYYGEGDYENYSSGESDYAVRAVGEDFLGYILYYNHEVGYRLRDLDSGGYIADGLQKGGFTIQIADDAEIYMLKDMVEEVLISPDNFKKLNWDNPAEVLGDGLWDTYLPIYGTGRVENNKLVYFKQSFRS